ncbi:MFS transporter [Paraferrimonas sp. SM1919]|uniref:MFS transporter n=1 Tax=Paraferrimonas sp. SM1919 TaxID=2662263 RepID=UPI0013CFDA00|nr:MFS transporter [Paraferrimonas sp. SM1919]
MWQQLRATLSLQLIALACLSGYFALPLFLGEVVAALGLSELQAGLLAAADLLGIGLMSMVLPFTIKCLINWRNVVYSLWVAMVASLLSMLANSFELLLVCRLLAGMAAGFSYASALVVLARQAQPTLHLGAYNILATGLITVFMFGLPSLLELGSYQYALALMALIQLVCMLVVTQLPKLEFDFDGSVSSVNHGSSQIYLGSLMLLVCGLFYLNIGTIWAFIELIADESGFTTAEIGMALGISNVVSIGGGFLSAWLGERIGKVLPLMVGLFIQGCVLLVLWQFGTAISLTILVISLSTYFLLWNFIDVYSISLTESFDHSGKLITVVPAVQGFGSALAPVLFTSLWMQNQYSEGIPFALVAIGMAILVVQLVANLKGKQQ